MSATEERTAYVGSPVKRREDEHLLTGRGTFVDNMAPVGTVHMIVVRSPYAHARVTSVDVARAAGVSQSTVSLVLSGKSAGRIVKR